MSSICKICILATEGDVLAEITGYLDSAEKKYRVEASDQSAASDRALFDSALDSPTIFSIRTVKNGLAEIHFNCFGKVREISARLSTNLDTALLVILYQSVATASYWAYYRNGECLREIEAGEGEVSFQSGAPLVFESENLGTDISEEDDEPYYYFDAPDMDAYNAQVGFDIEVYRDSDSQWNNVHLLGRDSNSTESNGTNSRPWWRFW